MIEDTRSPVTFRREFIDQPEALLGAVEELSHNKELGVDLEMAQRVERKPGGIQEWRHVLALIQIAGGDLSVVVDPVRCRDLSPLRPLMAGSSRKVFLGGGQDAGLLQQTRIPARNIADVGEVALALFGRRQDGMAALADRIFGISLDKTVRRADWLARPLNPVLIAYAHRDAELTLLIYRWFRDHHPDVLRFHERVEFDPGLPDEAAEWLREIMTRPAADPAAVLMECGLDAANHADTLVVDMRHALQWARAPRLTKRLLRLAGDLAVSGLVPDIVPLLASPSSMLRGSAARAIGLLADADVGMPMLEPLLRDPIVDVARAAESAVRELQAPVTPVVTAADSEDAPAIGDAAWAALQALKERLEADG